MTYNIEVKDSNDDDSMGNLESLFPEGTETETTFQNAMVRYRDV